MTELNVRATNYTCNSGRNWVNGVRMEIQITNLNMCRLQCFWCPYVCSEISMFILFWNRRWKNHCDFEITSENI